MYKSSYVLTFVHVFLSRIFGKRCMQGRKITNTKTPKYFSAFKSHSLTFFLSIILLHTVLVWLFLQIDSTACKHVSVAVISVMRFRRTPTRHVESGKGGGSEGACPHCFHNVHFPLLLHAKYDTLGDYPLPIFLVIVMNGRSVCCRDDYLNP